MMQAAELAGLFAGHALWCIADGGDLIPMLAHQSHGERSMARLANEDAGQAVEWGREQLVANEMQAEDAALIYQGHLTLDDHEQNALIIEQRAYFLPGSEVVIAIPYEPQESGKFRVRLPVVLVWEGCDDFDLNEVMSAFFNGVANHKHGWAVWNEAFQE